MFDYSSLIALKDVSEEKLSALKMKKVMIIGVGGLGSWSSEFLVRSGVKNLFLVDDDVVEKKNVLRQNYSLYDTGMYKVDVLKNKFEREGIKVDTFKGRFNEDFDLNLLEDIDLVLDGTDNSESRFLIDRVCFDKNIPWIFASALSYFAYVKVIKNGFRRYGDFFKDKKKYGDVSSEGIFISSNVFAALMQVKLSFDLLLNRDVDDVLYYFDFKNYEFLKMR